MSAATADRSAARDTLRALIPRRRQVTVLRALVIAFVFAMVLTPILAAEPWLETHRGVKFVVGQPAPLTFRVTEFARSATGGIELHDGSIVVARGEIVKRDQAAAIDWIIARRPVRLGRYVAYFLLAFAIAGFYSIATARSNAGRRVRTHIVNLGAVAAAALLLKIALLTTSVSVLLAPVAIAAMVPALVYDRRVGLATGVVAALVMSMVAPFDLGVAFVLLAQAIAAGLTIPEHPRNSTLATLGSGFGAAAAAAFAYLAYGFLTSGALPTPELHHAGHSAWVAATAAGILAIVVSIPAIPLYQRMVGEISSAQLVKLESLAHPLLKQLAERAPGTWQHSLAIANMAALAARAIGADSRLVRVGAYFHDVGKSSAPKYFVENLDPGEASPHERMAVRESCAAMFAHVTEGIAIAQRAGVHARIIDFMHMHHGDRVLAGFWAKCNDQRNPDGLTIDEFRYPGGPPQTREAAILAICDAVETATRSLRVTTSANIDQVVQRIVYDEVHGGQLDQSGLSMSELRIISDVLSDVIRRGNQGSARDRRQHADDTAETVMAKQVAVEPVARRERAAPIAVPAIDANDLVGIATTLNATPDVVTDSTATQVTETRSIRAKSAAVVGTPDDELEIVDEIAIASDVARVPSVLSPRALAIAGDAVEDLDLHSSPPLTPGETLLGAPPATRAQSTARVRRKSTVGPSGGSFD